MERKKSRRPVEPQDEAVLENLKPSKTQVKQAMLRLQQLGVELSQMPKDKIKKLNLPEILSDALLDAQNITAHEGKRRQLQYIGKLMQQLDDETIMRLQTLIDSRHGKNKLETAKLHQIENWRDKLIADNQALTDFIKKYPCENDHLQYGRTLIRNARSEIAAQQAPKNSRLLYQWIKILYEANLSN